MRHFRLHLLGAVIVIVVVLTILFSHGIRIRLEWGSAGFVAGLICGILLMMEVHHRRKRREAGQGH
jgi:uncharacterized membrane protein (DUF2068 family)